MTFADLKNHGIIDQAIITRALQRLLDFKVESVRSHAQQTCAVSVLLLKTIDQLLNELPYVLDGIS